jgi:hypothetical protein
MNTDSLEISVIVRPQYIMPNVFTIYYFQIKSSNFSGGNSAQTEPMTGIDSHGHRH